MATFSRHALVNWNGDVIDGKGTVTAGTEAFFIPVTFPRVGGEPHDTTTPEEMLAASHAICYGIALRSVIAERGAKTKRIKMTATITAEKGTRKSPGIRIKSSHLDGVVEGLEGIENRELEEIAQTAEDRCTISNAIRGNVMISSEVTAVPLDEAE